MGIRHLVRQKWSRAELALEAYENLLHRIYRNTESLTRIPIGGSGGGSEIPFYWKDRYTTQSYTGVRVIDGII